MYNTHEWLRITFTVSTIDCIEDKRDIYEKNLREKIRVLGIIENREACRITILSQNESESENHEWCYLSKLLSSLRIRLLCACQKQSLCSSPPNWSNHAGPQRRQKLTITLPIASWGLSAKTCFFQCGKTTSRHNWRKTKSLKSTSSIHDVELECFLLFWLFLLNSLGPKV